MVNTDEIEIEARIGANTLAMLGLGLFPIFSTLDYLTQFQDFQTLSLIRFTTTFFFGCVYFAFRKGKGLKNPFFAANFILCTASLSITLMCMVLDGAESPYYGGVNLVVLAGVLILPTNHRSMMKTVSMIIGIYIVGVLSVEEFPLTKPAAFINNMAFIFATGVVGVTAAFYKNKLRKEKNEANSAIATRDSFISMASHELKTPLTSIKLQMDLALIKIKNNEMDVLRPVSVAYRQIDNITRLVDEMLDVSRIQSGKFILQKGDHELNELVSGVIGRFYAESVALGRLKILLNPSSIPLSCDAFKLEQVVLNLINNAIKYGDGSQVSIELRRLAAMAQIIVSDQGRGIPPMDQSKIFDKFERGSSSLSGGLGLGLFISKEIVEAHGGSITLTSEQAKGSIFTVTLPL